MTDTLAKPDVDVDLEADASCSVTGVNNGYSCMAPAVYQAVLECCGYQKLLCEEHITQFVLRQGTGCRSCRQVRPAVSRYWPV